MERACRLLKISLSLHQFEKRALGKSVVKAKSAYKRSHVENISVELSRVTWMIFLAFISRVLMLCGMTSCLLSIKYKESK